jgi:outer membrane protein assembly factor BamB
MELFTFSPNLLSSDLAVVPIVAAAGSAILPTLAAAGATLLGLLLKPKELVAACKRKPHVPILMIVVIALIWGGFHWFHTKDSGKGRQRGGSTEATTVQTSQTDWTRVALEIIQQQKNGTAFQPPVVSLSNPLEKPPVNPTEIERTTDRRNWDGGAAPTNLSKAWNYYPTWIDDDGSVKQEKDALVLSSPLAAGDRVFGASCLMDPPNTYGAVFCLDAITGEQRWITELVGDIDLKGFFSSPALSADGKSLVIGQGLHPDANCMLVCLDADSGAVRWSVPTELHIESSPAIDGNVVVVGCGAIENPANHKPISHPGYVLAVDLETGEELWRYDVNDPESSPTIVDGIVYIGSGFNGDAIVALRTESDEELKAKGLDRLLWKVKSDYPVTGAVTVSGDTVLVGGGNGDFVYSAENPAGMVMALNKTDGSLLWSAQMPDSVLGALATDGDIVICPVANGAVQALELKTGTPRWSVQANGRSPVLAGSAFTDESVYVVSKDGYLIRLAAADGAVQEKTYINDPQRPGASGLSISSPSVANGRVYVGSETGGLRCYIGGAQ